MNARTRSWFIALMIAASVLGFMLWLANPQKVAVVISQANLALLTVALLLLGVESICTSLRIQHCVNHPVAFAKAVYSNSIYIAWLGILPARLGEVAGVAVFSSKLGMTLGSAIASVVVQRIYDVLILCGLLLALLSQTLYGGTLGLLIACSVLVGLTILLLTLPFWIDLSARILFPWRRKRWLKVLLHIALQARTWYRHQSQQSAVVWLTTTTLAKWLVNLSAIVLIFYACQIELSAEMLALIAILMHFLGAVPIQSFGGFGVADVGLTGILVSQGIPADQAVATSLVVRLTSLSFAGIFFTLAYLTLRSK